MVRGAILLLNQDVEARDVLDFMTTSYGIRRKLFFQEKVFYCGRCRKLLLLIFLFRRAPFMESFMESMLTFHEGCPFEQEDEEQQPPTEQNENRKEQDLPEATPEIYQYPEIPSKRNKVEQNDAALGQPTAEENGAGKNENESKRKTEANWRVIVHLSPMRLSNNETQWYRGKRWGRPTRQLLTNKRRKLLLSFLQHPSKTKDLIQGNPCSHGMRKRGTGTSRVVPKRRRACEDSNPVTKRAS